MEVPLDLFCQPLDPHLAEAVEGIAYIQDDLGGVVAVDVLVLEMVGDPVEDRHHF